MFLRQMACVVVVLLLFCGNHFATENKSFGQTLKPMRPLPQPKDSNRALPVENIYFVDANNGDDKTDGSKAKPWKSVNRALRGRQPGDTVCLRGGIYYEHVVVPVSGSEELPITIRSYPNELAVIDGGLREFLEHPGEAWEPLEGGAKDEYVSTRTYPQFSQRPIVSNFPAAGWEPFYGKEDERPVVLGFFAKNMIPLHGYRSLKDLRDDSMLWDVGSKFDNDAGVYCGPGIWFNRETERIHIRLAPTSLKLLGDRNYQGETDPRKVPSCLSGPYGADVLRINGVHDVQFQDIVLRGASGSPLVNVYGSDRIAFDGVIFFGGAPGMLVKATSQLKITNCAFRGLAAPWSSRASMKYRGTPSYQLIAQRNQPLNHDWEISNCEFTDDHDGIWVRYVKNLRFHHNFVENFNDDGFEVGARKRDQELYVYNNLFSRCQITFTLHEMEKDESPTEFDPGSGVYITRNIINLRNGTFKSPPKTDDDDYDYLNGAVTLCGDHGGPRWPNYYFYHNTVLRNDNAWRGYYGFGMGARGTRKTYRRVFNNIFVQINGIPGLSFPLVDGDLQVDGNLHWGVIDGPNFKEEFFTPKRYGAYRKVPMPDGWMKNDLFADPRLKKITVNRTAAFDVSLTGESPAIDAGVTIPRDWFEPFRESDAGKPDLGALPLGTTMWTVGVRGRILIGQ